MNRYVLRLYSHWEVSIFYLAMQNLKKSLQSYILKWYQLWNFQLKCLQNKNSLLVFFIIFDYFFQLMPNCQVPNGSFIIQELKFSKIAKLFCVSVAKCLTSNLWVHSSLLRTFGFSAISTSNYYLQSIFGTNALI